MNLRSYKTNQQCFEVFGAGANGIAFGYLSGEAELYSGEHLQLALTVALSICGYLCTFYFVNRQFRFAHWSYRPHWILICVIGTVFMYAALEAPDFLESYGPLYGTGTYLIAALVQEVTVCIVMMLPFACGVWLTGVIVRQVMARYGQLSIEDNDGV